jgi:hypothetical protein
MNQSGRKQGPTYHSRYFQLKNYSASQRDAFVERNKPKYIAFGTAATLLQLIPGASILFMYTNTVGAALWAAELERKGLSPQGEDTNGNELSGGPGPANYSDAVKRGSVSEEKKEL